jgi:hopanoid biosynthesis associated protein HpnK
LDRDSVKRLVVTADDFGAALEVNEAVEQAHGNGILTAASLMVGAPALADAVARARRAPSLHVGLHVVLVDGRPMLPPSAIPDLVDANGNFRNDLTRLGAAMFFRAAVRKQLAAEIEAQFHAFRETGLALDHVNAHKHFHLHPTVAKAIIEIGRRFGMRAVRVPSEPRPVLAAAEPEKILPRDYLTRPFARMLRKRLAAQGLGAPDAVFGLAWSGAMTAARLRGVLAHLPQGLSEIYLHPASRSDFAGAVPGYYYDRELEALIDPEVQTIVQREGIVLGGYSDFCGHS